VKRPRIVLRRRDEREEEAEPEQVVRLVRVDDEDARCKSACSEEADVVSHTWLHHTELFG
jgi:hypothetical protein